LEVPKTKYKTLGDKAFMFAAPKEWNALPSELRSLEDITVLKKQLKTLGVARAGNYRKALHPSVFPSFRLSVRPSITYLSVTNLISSLTFSAFEVESLNSHQFTIPTRP